MMDSRLPGSTASTYKISSAQTAALCSSRNAAAKPAAAPAVQQREQPRLQQGWAGSGVTSLTSQRASQKTQCGLLSCSWRAAARSSSKGRAQWQQQLRLRQASCQITSPRGPYLVSTSQASLVESRSAMHVFFTTYAVCLCTLHSLVCIRVRQWGPVAATCICAQVRKQLCLAVIPQRAAVPSRDPASIGRLVLQSLGSPEWWAASSSGSSSSWQCLEGAMLAAVAKLRLAVQDATCTAVVTCPASEWFAG
jgi:hypothetical protein